MVYLHVPFYETHVYINEEVKDVNSKIKIEWNILTAKFSMITIKSQNETLWYQQT